MNDPEPVFDPEMLKLMRKQRLTVDMSATEALALWTAAKVLYGQMREVSLTLDIPISLEADLLSAIETMKEALGQ